MFTTRCRSHLLSKMFTISLALLVFSEFSELHGARILGVFLTPMISTQGVYQCIWKELSLRGHEVTVITPTPLKDPNLVNLTEIDLKDLYNILTISNMQQILESHRPITAVMKSFYEMNANFTKGALSNAGIKALIEDKTRKFDVVLTLNFYPTMFILSNIFRCPLIIMTPSGFMINYDTVGNPSHPVLYPDAILPVVYPSGFFDRIYSAYYALWRILYYYYYVTPEYDNIARRYVRQDLPYLGDIQKNASMMLVNVNPIIYNPRPNIQGLIEFGNIYINKNASIPVDLQDELEKATQGFVYFSMGSIIKTSAFSDALIKTIVAAFSELPYKFFWKWETETLPGQPSNVIIRKWFPQQGLLSHPNIKAFMTHGGLQSVKESIANRVPIIGVPFFLDQMSNVMRMVNKGVAQRVDLETATKEELKAAIVEVVENPKYHNKMNKISELSSDTPLNGMETVIWWIEYVIRHRGAAHLRSPALNLPWYQYILLDVVTFLLSVFIVTLFLIYKIASICMKYIRKCFINNHHQHYH